MTQEPRKATDVLIEMESNVRQLLDIVRAQDLNIKVLSNKLNELLGRLDRQDAVRPKITVEAIQNVPLPAVNFPPAFPQMPAGEPERTIPVTAENRLPQENNPQGFRRTSRPETFSPEKEIKMPIQMPKMPAPPPNPNAMRPPPGRSAPESTAMMPPGAVTNRGQQLPPMQSPPMPTEVSQPPSTTPNHDQVPTQQRCVDKNGKSIFLADVQITDMITGQPYFKTRTNGTGKWMASLPVGEYRVLIRKQGSSLKDKVEAIQDVHVDGSKSPLELPMLIIK
jgi:hypothetical protein